MTNPRTRYTSFIKHNLPYFQYSRSQPYINNLFLTTLLKLFFTLPYICPFFKKKNTLLFNFVPSSPYENTDKKWRSNLELPHQIGKSLTILPITNGYFHFNFNFHMGELNLIVSSTREEGEAKRTSF